MFFFGSSKKKPATMPMKRGAGASQKRGAYRASVEFALAYRVEGRDGWRNARANDLSAGGLRLLGDEDFTNETMLELGFTLPSDFLVDFPIEKEIEEPSPFGTRTRIVKVDQPPFEPMRVRGQVVIAFFNVYRKQFAHGIKFVDVDEHTREEIQRFIHLWQLRQIRERAQLNS